MMMFFIWLCLPSSVQNVHSSMCLVCLSVERYVGDLHKRGEAAGEGVYALPTGGHVKDNEQVMLGFSTTHFL